MFESVRPDPGGEGLTKASRIFYVLAVLGAIGALVQLGLALADHRPLPILGMAADAVLAVVCVVVGNGIDQQRPWARWLGFAVAAIELLNVPIGTVIGIVLIVYLYRASKAGLFNAAAGQ